jgi:hypothetical protein
MHYDALIGSWPIQGPFTVGELLFSSKIATETESFVQMDDSHSLTELGYSMLMSLLCYISRPQSTARASLKSPQPSQLHQKSAHEQTMRSDIHQRSRNQCIDQQTHGRNPPKYIYRGTGHAQRERCDRTYYRQYRDEHQYVCNIIL